MSCQPSNRRKGLILVAAGGLAVAVAAGCTQAPPQVGDALLARASGVHDVPAEAADAPVVEVVPNRPTTIPDAPVVRLAIDRKAPWAQVQAVLAQTRARGQRVVFLVSQRYKVKAFTLSEPLEAESFELIAIEDGQSCVSPRGTAEGKCVKTKLPTFTAIDVAGTREIVRQAVNVYGMTDIEVELRGNLSWADVVRAVDAARTCCRHVTPRVYLEY